MMGWGMVLAHALWIGGLALGLAVLSVANYRAGVEEGGSPEARLRAEADLRPAAYTAAILFFLGLALATAAWWQRALAAAAGVVLAVWALAAQRQALAAATGRWRAAVQPAGQPSRRVRLLGWGLVAAGLLIVVGWSLMAGVETAQRARSLQAHVRELGSLTEAGPASLGAADLARAGEHLTGMHHDLATMQRRIGPLLPLGRLLGWVPTYGGDLAAAADLLALATDTAAAGDRTFQALSPALGLLEGTGGGSGPAPQLGEQLVPILAAARPELVVAWQDLQAAALARGRVEAGDLSPRVVGLLGRLDRYQPWLETAVGGALLAPDLLGAGGPRTYLVVAQNNHELRATGGFISGVGELHVDGGRIASLAFRDSYAVDNFEVPHEAAPADLQATLAGEMWLFRDANWWADFGASAREMLALYARDQGVQAEGVITVNLGALALLLDALGPLRVEGVDREVTGGNVQQILQEQWANPSAGPGLEEGEQQAWWEHRKDFMGEVAAALVGKVQGGQDVGLGALAGALEQALREKHILLYLADAEAAELLRDRNWDGAVPADGVAATDGAGDYLLVVDSNVGFNKVDPNVTRTIRYEVDLGVGDGPRARLTLTYRNGSRRPVDVCLQEARYGDVYADMMDRCYWDYVRAYAPADSRLLAWPELPLPTGSLLARNGATGMPPDLGQGGPGTEGGLAVWRGFFALAPGEERALAFEYELPASVLERTAEGLVRYRLYVQKQPGTGATRLDLEVTLPPGAGLAGTVPAGLFSQQDGYLVAASDLRADRQFEILFREGTAGP